MMDVPELRSLFITNEVTERERIPSRASGGQFDETLSRFSQAEEGLSESPLSPEDSSGLPMSGAVDQEKAGENGEGAASPVFSASGGSVLESMNDSDCGQEVIFPVSTGSGTYRRLLSREETSPEEVLCEDFRQLKLSARAFGTKTGMTASGAVSGKEGDLEPDSDPADVPGEAGTTDVEVGETGPMVLPCGSAEIPVDGVLSLTADTVSPEGEAFSREPAGGETFHKMSVGRLSEGLQIASEESSSVSGDFVQEFSLQEPEGFRSPQVFQAEEKAVLQQEVFSGEGKASGMSRSDGVSFPEIVSETTSEPVAGTVAPTREMSTAAVSTVWQETGSAIPANGGEARPLKGYSEETGTVDREDVDFADEGLLPDAFRPGPESRDIRWTPSLRAEVDGSAAGQSAGTPVAESPEFVILSGRDAIVHEGEKDPAMGEDVLSSPVGILNPMEGTSVKTAAGDIFLEARGVEAMARGLAETVHVVRKRDGHRGTIEVSPPELGQVRITLESSGDTVQVHLRVESVQVRDMLDQTADVLKQSLEDQGLSLTGMSVDVGGQDGGGSPRGSESGPDSFPGHYGEDTATSVGDEAEEVIARLDLERGMLHWVA